MRVWRSFQKLSKDDKEHKAGSRNSKQNKIKTQNLCISYQNHRKSDNEKILKDVKRGVETRLKQENV